MRKILLCIIVLIISTLYGWTQNMADVKLHIFTGGGGTTARYLVDGVKQPTTTKIGGLIGIGARIPWDINLYFSPEISYSIKGYDVKFNRPSLMPSTTAIDNSVYISTLEMSWLVEYDIMDNIFLRLGPSFDYQLFGTEKFHQKDGSMIKRRMPFAFWEYGYVGASLVFKGGVYINRVYISPYYYMGICNMNNKDGGPNIRYKAYGLSLGIMFF